MATITPRKRRDGSTSCTAQIRINRGGERYTESATFSTRKLAESWARTRESAIERDGIPRQHEGATVAELVEWYERDVYALRKWGSAKAARLKLLRESELGSFSAERIAVGELLEHMARRRKRVAPSTVLQELTWLRIVLRAARAMLNVPVVLDVAPLALAQFESRYRQPLPGGGALRLLLV
nr:hypothetical protein [Plasticicumulans lactativorans]